MTTETIRSRLRGGWATAGSILALLAWAVFAAPAAFAASARHANLVDLMAGAEAIVVGEIRNVSDGFDANGLPYTEVTLRVADQIKGRKTSDEADTFTFRQFGLLAPRTMPDGRINMNVTPNGWSEYAVGEEVALFLSEPARLTGLRTTVGLQQGKVSVRNNRIRLAAENAGLFKDVAFAGGVLNGAEAELVTRGRNRQELDAQAFVKLVRKAEKENWIGTGRMKNEG